MNAENTFALILLCSLLCTVAGCAGMGPGSTREQAGLNDFLGSYKGSFGSALTKDPLDDLNYNPCDNAKERCLGEDAYLADIVLDLSRDADNRLRLRFFRSPGDQKKGTELDLLGFGCATRIGVMNASTRDSKTGKRIASFPLTAQNRMCLNKLRPTNTHEIKVTLNDDPESGTRLAHALIDKNVVNANYLYVVEDGVERRVKIDTDNTLKTPTGKSYRVCIENRFGEFESCVLTDRELKQVLLPVPVPGGVAVNYTWWYKLTPNLKRTQGLYRLEQYSGRFAQTDS